MPGLSRSAGPRGRAAALGQGPVDIWENFDGRCPLRCSLFVSMTRDDLPKEARMKYALLIYPKPGSHEALGPDEYGPVNAQYLGLREDPRCLGGAHLQPAETATTVRYSPGQALITDGPFADTKEVLGGYYVLDAANLDEALEFVQRIPAVRLGGAVEVRPLVEIMEDGF
jgi:hypothetical protein